VSDKCEKILDYYAITSPISAILHSLVIPATKPDPLVEALKNMDVVMERLEAFRAALEARGLEIREKGLGK
jgi:hypothetical protein